MLQKRCSSITGLLLLQLASVLLAIMFVRFKLNFINQIPHDEEVTAYKCGDFIDLCKGPHIPNTDLIKAFEMHTVSFNNKFILSCLLYM